MSISWSWRIAALYLGFVTMMIGLVVATNHQKIDLVSKDYYKEEVGYQKVIDASNNQASLSGKILVHANSSEVTIDLPAEFANKVISGNVSFYSPVSSDWDKAVELTTGSNSLTVSRSSLHATPYKVKISYKVDGKDYYYETDIDLHK